MHFRSGGFPSFSAFFESYIGQHPHLNIFIHMQTVEIIRQRTGNQGTEGILQTSGFTCFTLELPWKDNARRMSCIPKGTYSCKVRHSPRFGEIYHVIAVPNRSYILIHSGNFAGDVTRGFRTHVEGCILLGSKRGVLRVNKDLTQRAVLVSKPTVRQFMQHMAGKDFTLKISGVPHV